MINHFVGIANGVNHVLVPHATVLICEVETLETRFGLLAALVGWGAERALRLGPDAECEAPEGGPPVPWTVLPAMAQGRDVRPDSALTSEDRRLRDLAERVAREVAGCWARLLALEQVVGEVLDEFGDEVVIPEVLRDFLLLIRAKLERLYADAPDSWVRSTFPRRTQRSSTCSTAASTRSAGGTCQAPL